MTVYAWFVRGERHGALCATSIESVRRIDPYARFVVMTDDDTALPRFSREKLTVGSFQPGLPMMLANLEAQCQVLGRYAVQGEQVCFLDTDILLLDPLPFSNEADLWVTWRDHVGVDEKGERVAGLSITMPYNYGVIGARAGMETLEAFIWMRERIRRMNQRLQTWYGNQVALAALCGRRPESGTLTEERAIPWSPTQLGNTLRVMKLPGERWNWTPQKVGERTHGVRSALHFKGPARALMESYAGRLDLPWYVQTKAAA